MIPEKVKVAFEEIQKRLEIPEYLESICSTISSGSSNLQTIRKTLNEHKITEAIAKRDFLSNIISNIPYQSISRNRQLKY